jgi:hypothetical protein
MSGQRKRGGGERERKIFIIIEMCILCKFTNAKHIFITSIKVSWHFHKYWQILIAVAIKKILENTYNELKSCFCCHPGNLRQLPYVVFSNCNSYLLCAT